MWLMTTFGFFSVVQKKGTRQLTVRARVGSDLDRLRDRYLPTLTSTFEKPGSDYRYRATVPHADLGAAMSRIVSDIRYDNFKSEVEDVQGHARESVYAKAWRVLDSGLPPLDELDLAAKKATAPESLPDGGPSPVQTSTGGSSSTTKVASSCASRRTTSTGTSGRSPRATGRARRRPRRRPCARSARRPGSMRRSRASSPESSQAAPVPSSTS